MSEVHLPDERLNISSRQQCDELKFLEKNIYVLKENVFEGKADNILFYQGKNVHDEVENAACEIRRIIREEGASFKDIAIIASEKYADTVANVFGANGIPVFIKREESLLNTNILSFVISAIKIITKNFRWDIVVNYIKTGLSGLSDEECSLLMNYQRETAMRGFMLKKPLAFIPEGFERAEEIRQKLLGPLDDFSQSYKGRADEKIEAIEKLLIASGAEEKMNMHSEMLLEMGEAQLSAKSLKQLSAAKELFSQLKRIFKDSVISKDELAEIISVCAKNENISIIPPRANEVQFLDIKKSKLADVKCVMMLGINSEYMPSNKNENALFAASEILRLSKAGIRTGFLVKDQAERLDIYSALAAPKNLLYLSLSAGDKSSVLEKILRMFPKARRLKASPLRIPGEFGAYKNMAKALALVASGEKAPEELKGIYNWFLKSEEFAPSFNKLKRELSEIKAAPFINEERAHKLYGKMSGSVSRAEKYMNCPFMFYLEKGLKLKEQREFSDRKTDTGSILHECIDLFFKLLKENEQDITLVSEKEALDIMRRAYESVFEKTGFFEDPRRGSLKSMVIKQLMRAVKSIRWQLIDTNTKVFKTEAKAGEDFSPFYINVGDSKININGTIDRIDILKTPAADYFRVVDNKSRDMSFDAQKFVMGTRIQLIIYLMMLTEHFKSSNAYPQGAYYFNLGFEYSSKGEDAEKRKMKGISSSDLHLAAEFCGTAEGRIKGIDIRLKSNGEAYSDSAEKMFASGEMQNLFDIAKGVMTDAISDMYKGNIRPLPAKFSDTDIACTYCKFKTICRREETGDFRHISKEEAKRAIGKEKSDAKVDK